jgi:hypothetical protein
MLVILGRSATTNAQAGKGARGHNKRAAILTFENNREELRAAEILLSSYLMSGCDFQE